MGQTAALHLTRGTALEARRNASYRSRATAGPRAESPGPDRLALPFMRASHGRKRGAAIERKGGAVTVPSHNGKPIEPWTVLVSEEFIKGYPEMSDQAFRVFGFLRCMLAQTAAVSRLTPQLPNFSAETGTSSGRS